MPSPPILYSFGKMIIDGQSYNHDLKIIGDKVIPHWWREQGHFLQIQDVQDILDYHPDFLVIGTGAFGIMKVSAELLTFLEKQKIKTFVEKTATAASTFCTISSEHSKAGAFHLTC